jgi:hypothetical protein
VSRDKNGKSDEYERQIAAVIECKRRDTLPTTPAFLQAQDYAHQTNARYFAITNGDEVYTYEQKGRSTPEKKRFPNYRDVLKQKKIPDKPAFAPYKRPTWRHFQNPAWVRRTSNKEFGVIMSRNAPDWMRRYILDLFGLMMSCKPEPSLPWAGHGIRIVEDWGPTIQYFSNPSGGAFPGEYRTFIVRRLNKRDAALVHFSIFPTFSRGEPDTSRTYFVVAVSDEKRSHTSVELQMEKYWSLDRNRITVTHDGRMAAGQGGSVPRKAVLDYVEHRDPSMVKNGNVYLGTLPTNRQFQWSNTRDMLIRTASYALLRDDIRTKMLRSRGAFGTEYVAGDNDIQTRCN